jgi:hypothetical protein
MRFAVAFGACTSYSFAVQVETVRQMRFDVAVGGVCSYSTPLTQIAFRAQLDCPVEDWCWLAPQTVHAVWPVALCAVPAAQGAQLSWPASGWAVPTSQGLHERGAMALGAASSKEPATQGAP